MERLCRNLVQPDPEETYRDRLRNEIRIEKNYGFWQKKISAEIVGADTIVKLNIIKWSLKKIFRGRMGDALICLSQIQRKRKEILFKKTLHEISKEYFKLTGEKID